MPALRLPAGLLLVLLCCPAASARAGAAAGDANMKESARQLCHVEMQPCLCVHLSASSRVLASFAAGRCTTSTTSTTRSTR
jgi:hypothetical protein